MLLQPTHQSLQNLTNTTTHYNRIVYLVHHPDTNIFCPESLQRFNLYKKFVQNTIMELGQDWRIESGLLAQEIMTQKSLTNDQFCIFNQFMAGFLRKRLGQERNQIHTQSNKMLNEQQTQEQFLKYFNKSISKSTDQALVSNGTNGNTYNQNTDFSSNLTFKTLSLGFYITVNDIWTRIFKKYHKELIEQKLSSFNLGHDKKLSYFGTVEIGQFGQEKWVRQEDRDINQLLALIEGKIGQGMQRGEQYLANAVRLGSVVANIQETSLRLSASTPQIKIRTFTLSQQFYLHIFLIWLIFNIKKSFNSSLFSPTCFLRYCDIIIGSKIINYENGSKVQGFHSVYKQFKGLCDDEWKKLMKDYMIALNDDKEVLRTLVGRVGEKVKDRFEREVEQRRVVGN